MGRPKKLRWEPGDWGVKNPGLFPLFHRLLRRLRPDLYGLRGWLAQRRHDRAGTVSDRDYYAEQLWLGSIQAAVVHSTEPGRVAAYSDMLDCVAALDVPEWLVARLGLREGDRLLTVNYYDTGEKHADLDFGPGKCSDWTGLKPLIADFVSDDEDRLAERKAALPDRFFRRAEELGREYLKRRPGQCRPAIWK